MKWAPQIIDGGCWVLDLKPNSGGYVLVWHKGRPQGAHRVFYEETVGQIPDDLTIDHLCRNPSCVNPEHMEPVTMRENILRSNGLAAQNARKTECLRGHAFYIDKNGRRYCRVCDRAKQRRLAAAWSDKKRKARNEYNRQWRAANRDHYRAQQRERRRKAKAEAVRRGE